MANIVDARGRSCPEPVILTKNAIDNGHKNIEILVDAKVAVENIKRFATSQGYTVEVEEKEDEYSINLRK